MNCRHDTRSDWSIIIQSFSHWSQTVCCTRSSRNDIVVLCKSFVVYIVNDCWKIISSWSRNYNFFSTCSNVSSSFIFCTVETCTFKNYVNFICCPRTVSCIFFSRDFDFFSINNDRIFCSFYSVFSFTNTTHESTLSCIIFKKVSKHFWACQIVDSNNFITISFEHLTESQTTNTAKTINSNSNCHFISPKKLD